jgi:SAM-dependent methyltransferase
MGVILKIGKYLPESVKPFARKVLYYSPIVPVGLLKATYSGGGGDFEEVGKDILQRLIEIGGLKPTERVLDVGCSVGRIAIPLTEYLKDGGSYEGFDIVPKEIKWCQKKISTRFPNFRFQLADVYNKVYNPYGKYRASEYKFPYDDESFDFIFLTSVFTHMITKDMENYLSEIARVLRKETGRCFITYFLLNSETRRLIEQNQSRYEFSIKRDDGCYVAYEQSPEAALAYDEKFIRKLYEQYHLNIIEPIYFGAWRRGKDHTTDQRNYSRQDFILAKYSPDL